jgi:putative transposase
MGLKKNNPESRQRVVNFELKPNKEQDIILGCLTYAASKLWNVGNYERRSWTRESGIPYPDWFLQKRNLKCHFWYKNLPSQTAQEILKQLHEGWKSFYRLKKTGGIDNPKPPGYKHSNFNIRYLNNGFTVSEQMIRLSVPRNQKAHISQTYDMAVDFLYIRIPEKYRGTKGNIKVIEIMPIPKSSRYKIRIIIELPKVPLKEDNGIYMSIDLGVNNLITCYASTGNSLIISGRQLLSLNRYYDKEIGYYQSIAYAQQSMEGIKYPKDTKHIRQMYEKRGKQVDHILHTATKQVMDFAIQENVNRIIIGNIAHIRDDSNWGRVNNQKLHKWPFGKISNLLSYKAKDRGIDIDTQEEKYTSQCSPHAVEVSKEHANRSNRKYRGLYVVGGKAYNADCVGAYNILKKYLCRIGHKTIPAVVGLDTPKAYRWNNHCFVESPKLAFSKAM